MFTLKRRVLIQLQAENTRRLNMNAHVFVLTFLAVALAAMVYVIGMPWHTPKPREVRRSRRLPPRHHGRG
jgi:hypothetical protein